jgi:hypothetical protein
VTVTEKGKSLPSLHRSRDTICLFRNTCAIVSSHPPKESLAPRAPLTQRLTCEIDMTK